MASMESLKNNKRIVLLIFSVFFSSFIINLFIRNGFSFEYLFLSMDSIYAIMEEGYLISMFFILLKRLKHFLIIYILMKVIKPEYVYNGLITILSIMLGIMLTVQTYYEGISGVFLFLLYIVPHYIVYLILLRSMYEGSGTLSASKLKFTVTLLLLLAMGVLCEGFFSRFFLQEFYQYMVFH